MKPSAILLATHNSLRKGGGGVQLCTADYVSHLIELFNLKIVSFSTDMRLGSRVANRTFGQSYRRQVPPRLALEIEQAMDQHKPEYVFFNLLDFPREAQNLRRKFGSSIKLVHLSHGLASTDLGIDQQFHRNASGRLTFDRKAALALGSQLQFEADYRRYLDGSICLSPLDAEIERWLGVHRAFWLPHSIREPRLDHVPLEGRIGCVATLDHPPNRNGLVEFFATLREQGAGRIQFRLVGNPPSIGKEFAEDFPFVQFLGQLADEELRAEAATWSCFVHPIFAYARGRSTKVGVVLGWGLPLVTTRAGIRGYVWDETLQPLFNTPAELARAALARSKGRDGAQNVDATAAIARLQPSREVVADRLVRFIQSL